MKSKIEIYEIDPAIQAKMPVTPKGFKSIFQMNLFEYIWHYHIKKFISLFKK